MSDEPTLEAVYARQLALNEKIDAMLASDDGSDEHREAIVALMDESMDVTDQIIKLLHDRPHGR